MKSFDQLDLSPELLEGVAKLGFKKPTEVQSAVIPVLLGGSRDLVALAQTGTGKTAAFGLPILQLLDPDANDPQALILCPTRELCMQIARDVTQLAGSMRNVRILPVYGGADIQPQLKSLRRGVQIVVATPGRMVDMLRRRAIDLSVIRHVVLDEADEMLTMGFEEDLKTILAAVPKGKQTLLFSATMPRTVAAIKANDMTDPLEITIGERNTGPDNVVHEYYMVHARDRYPALKRIVDLIPELYGIVFCRTRQDTQEIADWLARDGYLAQALHGDLSQPQRDKVMKGFRDRDFPLLVATDVAARGLDVRNLTHVINYSLPDELGTYTHRSGRTGRAGQSGISIALLNLREHSKLHQIEKQLGRKFIARPVPTGDDICRVRVYDWIKRWQALEPNSALLDELMPAIAQRLEGLSREDLLRKMVAWELRLLLDYYRNQPDINPDRRLDSRSETSAPSRGSGVKVELVLNVGSVNGLRAKSLLQMIETTVSETIPVGRINISKMQSYVEVPAAQAANLVASINAGSRELDGRLIRIAVARPHPGRSQRLFAKRAKESRGRAGKRRR